MKTLGVRYLLRAYLFCLFLFFESDETQMKVQGFDSFFFSKDKWFLFRSIEKVGSGDYMSRLSPPGTWREWRVGQRDLETRS